MKKNIVGLMLKTPEAIQRQLSDAIAVIGERGGGGDMQDKGGEVGHYLQDEGERWRVSPGPSIQ